MPGDCLVWNWMSAQQIVLTPSRLF